MNTPNHAIHREIQTITDYTIPVPEPVIEAQTVPVPAGSDLSADQPQENASQSTNSTQYKSSSTARSIVLIAEEYEKAIESLEELSTSGEAFYETWLQQNQERLKMQAMVALRQQIQHASHAVSRLQSEFEAANSSLARRLTAVKTLSNT